SSGTTAGKPIQAYGYGPFGLVQRYFTPLVTPPDSYFTYSFDPLGNLAGRHRKAAAPGDQSAYVASISAYDALGYLIIDASANGPGGVSFPPVDPIGPLGQQG